MAPHAELGRGGRKGRDCGSGAWRFALFGSHVTRLANAWGGIALSREEAM